MEKSFVGMETKICVVCGKEEESGSLLLDKRMRPSFEKNVCTGFGMCKKCSQLKEDGYVAFVGIDPYKTVIHGDSIRPEEAHRTGGVMHIKHQAAKEMMGVTDEMIEGGLIFIDQKTLDQIEAHLNKGEEE